MKPKKLVCSVCGYECDGNSNGWGYIQIVNKRTYQSCICARLCDHCIKETTIGGFRYEQEEEK